MCSWKLIWNFNVSFLLYLKIHSRCTNSRNNSLGIFKQQRRRRRFWSQSKTKPLASSGQKSRWTESACPLCKARESGAWRESRFYFKNPETSPSTSTTNGQSRTALCKQHRSLDLQIRRKLIDCSSFVHCSTSAQWRWKPATGSYGSVTTIGGLDLCKPKEECHIFNI